ncbi:MAG: hydrogenase nickel incorporation protein HypB [Burkholderiaceae bacterium]|nr:hydrogenase nickel incorporation protein HypB [Burkholderiaceae bacterium]
MCTHCGCGHDHHHTHDMSVSNERAIAIEEDILGRNNAIADENRAYFRQKQILALNLVSSPGSGKTELLTATILAAKAQLKMAVIEGDQQTSNDADRIRVTGAPAYQINTGKGCHLDASMVRTALQEMTLDNGSILFIENVGNLVCPAEFDLGEAHKVAILSVTEGEDKPLKYPDMFRAADVMIINKIDLLPYLRFDIDRCEAYARQVNPSIRILRTSATSGEGMDAWVKWLTVESALCNLE